MFFSQNSSVKMVKMKPQMGQNHFTDQKIHTGANFSTAFSSVSKIAIEATRFEDIAQKKMCECPTLLRV
jgi:hypothetical protein